MQYKGPGRPKSKKEGTKVVSARLRISQHELVILYYKNFQRYVDEKVRQDFGEPHAPVIIKREKVSIHDF